jgi:hypothetical protein
MGWNDNIFYNPEKHGLTVIGEVEFSDGFYQFDTRVAWRDEDGKVYTARDSGCSCPTPFEEFEKVSDLNPVTDWYEFKRLLDDELDACYFPQYRDDEKNRAHMEAHVLVGNVRDVLEPFPVTGGSEG